MRCWPPKSPFYGNVLASSNGCFVRKACTFLKAGFCVQVGCSSLILDPFVMPCWPTTARCMIRCWRSLQCMVVELVSQRHPRVLAASRRTACCGNVPASSRRRGGPRVAVTAPRPHGVAADRVLGPTFSRRCGWPRTDRVAAPRPHDKRGNSRAVTIASPLEDGSRLPLQAPLKTGGCRV